jgi:carbonic anhydrase
MRVAGNLLGDDVLASLQYALDHLGESLKLVVVLGHSGCGAVSAAVDAFLNPASYLDFAAEPMLRHLLDRLLIVVHAADRRMGTVEGAEIRRKPGYRAALIELAVATNAALAAHSIRRQFAAAREGRVGVVFGVYGLADRSLWAPTGDDGDHRGLAAPPGDEAEFFALADRVLRSRRIGALLSGAVPG